ncbi:hypothetical protein [uncultured Sphaerochaeta sp.]|uniref:hypothetical protein n=1 Tax=uncultured Sphaerochaeta sp. TaxID=886478 RepID=UPI002621B8EE|nr:hypothetical protein [uncultured Sphaerochaeta sp.]
MLRTGAKGLVSGGCPSQGATTKRAKFLSFELVAIDVLLIAGEYGRGWCTLIENGEAGALQLPPAQLIRGF